MIPPKGDENIANHFKRFLHNDLIMIPPKGDENLKPQSHGLDCMKYRFDNDSPERGREPSDITVTLADFARFDNDSPERGRERSAHCLPS